MMKQICISTYHHSYAKTTRKFPHIPTFLTTVTEISTESLDGQTFNGINLEECVAPIPGRPCLTGFYKISFPSTSTTNIRNTEFSEIMSSHFRLDFNSIEDFAIINPNHTPNHLGYNNHIP